MRNFNRQKRVSFSRRELPGQLQGTRHQNLYLANRDHEVAVELASGRP
jgi:hypothetical protein